jgi:hypothetical protein
MASRRCRPRKKLQAVEDVPAPKAQGEPISKSGRRKFYASCVFAGEEYALGEGAMLSNPDPLALPFLCRIMKIFTDSEQPGEVFAEVEWYHRLGDTHLAPSRQRNMVQNEVRMAAWGEVWREESVLCKP